MRTDILTKLPAPLYDVEFAVKRRSHIYSTDGIDYPSVTKILGVIGGGKTNALMIWARREALKLAGSELFKAIESSEPITYAMVSEILESADRQPDKIKDESADLGTRVHEAIDAYILGKEPILDDQSIIGFNNFLNWIESEGLKLVSGDIAVASKVYGFGGRLDAVGLNKDGGIEILDWKTSNALREEYPLQVAAYKMAFEETYGLKVAGARVVRFDKIDPNIFEAKPVNLPNAECAFLAALSLYNGMKTELWTN